MTSKDKGHIKHGLITKPSLGEWGRSEFAIYGTTCSQVAELVRMIRAMFPGQSIVYLDAHHDEDGGEISDAGSQFTVHSAHGNYYSSDLKNPYFIKSTLSNSNLVIVNGNHFQAAAQIVVINENKKKSLLKRAAELTNVKLILTPENDDSVPEFVREILGEKTDHIQVLSIADTKAISGFVEAQFLVPPVLKALILAGGRSSRMGEDKSLINYHGVEQIYHIKKITESLGLDTYVSCREDQRAGLDISADKIIADRMNDLGPLGGIISSFMYAPDNAWLVIACDLPFLDKGGIEYLINNRNHAKQATAFRSTTDNWPEPLAAIWEPASYSSILNFLAIGYSCPRKVLINTRTELLELPDAKMLTNVNSPDELQSARNMLDSKEH